MGARVKMLGIDGRGAGGYKERQTERELPQTEAIDDKPRSVYEIVTRQMLEQVKADVAEVKGRVNTLLWLVAGAMLLEVAMRLLK